MTLIITGRSRANLWLQRWHTLEACPLSNLKLPRSLWPSLSLPLHHGLLFPYQICQARQEHLCSCQLSFTDEGRIWSKLSPFHFGIRINSQKLICYAHYFTLLSGQWGIQNTPAWLQAKPLSLDVKHLFWASEPWKLSWFYRSWTFGVRKNSEETFMCPGHLAHPSQSRATTPTCIYLLASSLRRQKSIDTFLYCNADSTNYTSIL